MQFRQEEAVLGNRTKLTKTNSQNHYYSYVVCCSNYEAIMLAIIETTAHIQLSYNPCIYTLQLPLYYSKFCRAVISIIRSV